MVVPEGVLVEYSNPPSLWGLGLLDRLYASYRRNTLETTISRSIWIDSGGTVESTVRFRSKIQVRDQNWRYVSTIPIGIWILDPRSELIQGKRWQKGTEVSKCVEFVVCASKNQKSKNARPILTSKSGQNDPGTLIIGFALKNYAQKWSQIVKTLDGCLKTTILAFSSDHGEPLSECQFFPPALGSFHPPIDNRIRATNPNPKHKVAERPPHFILA